MCYLTTLFLQCTVTQQRRLNWHKKRDYSKIMLWIFFWGHDEREWSLQLIVKYTVHIYTYVYMEVVSLTVLLMYYPKLVSDLFWY